MKILITGASGCIGKELVNKLLNQNTLTSPLSTTPIQVLATDIKQNPFAPDANLQYKALDICSEAFFQWVCDVTPDVIIHLASVLQISNTMTRANAYQIDVVATERLLATSVEIGVQKFVITTSGAAYGYYPENNEGEITENRATNGNLDYFYSAHKAEVETILEKYRESWPKLQQVVLRPGAIIGPDFEGPVVNLFQQKMITGLVGYKGLFNFIWSEDVVDYLIEAAITDVTGQYNVAGTGSLSMKQIANKLNKPYIPLPPLLIQSALSILKPLGVTQYGPEQVKFIKYRPVLSNQKIRNTFKHQPKYTSEQALDAYLTELEKNQ